MRTAAALFVLASLVASPLAAQVRVPPGQLPRPGECRVWYQGRPPGQQPRPTSCREAERVASRDRNARVIYGGDPRDRGRAIPRRDVYGSVAFENGYKDGLDKGREDARDNDSYDPVRHRRYRSADRGYNKRYGTKDEYKDIYRAGFQNGYDDGYRARGIRR